jgi:predicted ATPase/DNA-binding CsgD family transcriptional regulator
MDCAETGTVDRRAGDVRVPRLRSAVTPDQRTAGDGRRTVLRALPRESAPPAEVASVRDERPIAGRRLHNLPSALTSFVGRELEIAEAGRLLAETRLLTLAGTGGIGKTRLGHKVAARLLEDLPDGAWVVELSALADQALVAQAVASVLGVREVSGRPLLATLAEALRGKRLLLVLDNCEHLIEACAALADALLRACPELRILTTSRQALGIAGETIFRVPSLALTGGQDALVSAGGSGASDAVRLFVERARAVVPGFTLTERSTPVLEQICARLDGIPLAIELAAARIAVLSPEQIADRLDDRFRLLSGGSRTALPRYRTLRALVDWSHALLTEPEQVLFRRLGVFAGGWSLEAAEAVCTGSDLASEDVLDLMSGLVEKSLVLPTEQAGEVRYGLLETLREYATERLRESGEDRLLRDRHAAWYLALAERAEPELVKPCQEAWLDRLGRERENLRSAQRWAVERGDAETVARLGAALWRFWWARADAADAREWMNTMVPLAQQSPPIPALVRALDGAAHVAGALADYATCRLLLDAGLAVARQLGDRPLLATLLDSRGRQSFVEGHYSEARVLLNECLAIMREIDDRHGLVRALSHVGFLEYLEGRQESARATYWEGLELARAAGDPNAVAEIFDNLGRTYQAEGDFDAALSAYLEAEAILREIGQGHRLAMVLNNLGSVQTLRDELGVARDRLAEALRLSQKIGNRRRLAFTLAAVATLAAVEGEAERAVRLHAIASAAVAEMGASLVQPMYDIGACHLERARRVLGATGCEAARVAGQVTTLSQAVDEALTWLAADPTGPAEATTPVPAAAPSPVPSTTPRPIPSSTARPTMGSSLASSPVPSMPRVSMPAPGGALSPRELEVAALVARGMTNRQIAAELIITEGTAANHVKHILARLTLDSRVQIASWATERGLHASAPSYSSYPS